MSVSACACLCLCVRACCVRAACVLRARARACACACACVSVSMHGVWADSRSVGRSVGRSEIGRSVGRSVGRSGARRTEWGGAGGAKHRRPGPADAAVQAAPPLERRGGLRGSILTHSLKIAVPERLAARPPWLTATTCTRAEGRRHVRAGAAAHAARVGGGRSGRGARAGRDFRP